MASRDSGTVRPTKRKRVFLAAAVLLLVCVLAAGAVSAATTVTVLNYEQPGVHCYQKHHADNDCE